MGGQQQNTPVDYAIDLSGWEVWVIRITPAQWIQQWDPLQVSLNDSIFPRFHASLSIVLVHFAHHSIYPDTNTSVHTELGSFSWLPTQSESL